MKISNKAYAILWTAQPIGLEVPPSAPDLRAWVTVCPFVKGKFPYGPGADLPFTGMANTGMYVYRFEVRKSTLDAGYDVVGELLNERRITVEGEGGIDGLLDDVERILESWGIDPSKLGPLDTDYPL